MLLNYYSAFFIYLFINSIHIHVCLNIFHKNILKIYLTILKIYMYNYNMKLL